MDLVGPLEPRTRNNNNRFFLTHADYASRYPRGVSLQSIDTKIVAEALVSIFSRVGVRSEILIDMGTQFTFNVLMELTSLLTFKQLLASPYYPTFGTI